MRGRQYFQPYDPCKRTYALRPPFRPLARNDPFLIHQVTGEVHAAKDLVVVGDNPELDEEQAIGAAFLLFDAVIGEQLVMTRIGAIDFATVPASDLAQGQGFKPLSELRREIQDRLGVEVTLD